MRRFVVIQPGDWPCQFYCRQIIHRCLMKFTRHNPERGDFPADSNMVVSHNHSSYSFPSTTAYTVNCFTHNMTSQLSLLSIVTTIGPLHISLNSREHVVSSFHPFFKYLYTPNK